MALIQHYRLITALSGPDHPNCTALGHAWVPSRPGTKGPGHNVRPSHVVVQTLTVVCRLFYSTAEGGNVGKCVVVFVKKKRHTYCCIMKSATALVTINNKTPLRIKMKTD